LALPYPEEPFFFLWPLERELRPFFPADRFAPLPRRVVLKTFFAGAVTYSNCAFYLFSSILVARANARSIFFSKNVLPVSLMLVALTSFLAVLAPSLIPFTAKIPYNGCSFSWGRALLSVYG